MPAWAYKAMLVLAPMIWGSSYVFVKNVVGVISPVWLITFRFLTAGVLLALAILPRLRKHMSWQLVWKGAVLGFVSFCAYMALHTGVVTTTPGKNAFLSATYCVIVPLLWWMLFRKRPRKTQLVAAVVCIAGIGLVSLDGSMKMGWGDGLSLLAGVLYSVEIIIIARIAQDLDVLSFTVVQLISMGLYGLVTGLVTQPFPALEVMDLRVIMELLYLILIASCLGAVLQNVGQKHVSASQAGLLMSLESVFGALSSIIFYGERPTIAVLVGFALIFGAVVLSEVEPKEKARP